MDAKSELGHWPTIGLRGARIGRAEWGTAFLAVFWVSSFIGGALLDLALGLARSLKSSPIQTLIVFFLVHLIVLVVTLAFQRDLSIKRARDRDARPLAFWAYAVATMLMTLSGVANTVRLRLPVDSMWIWLAWAAACAWIAVDLGLRRGDTGPNRWGPEPKRYIQTAFGKVDNYRAPRP